MCRWRAPAHGSDAVFAHQSNWRPVESSRRSKFPIILGTMSVNKASQIRTHRILCCLAIAHGASLLIIPSTSGDAWLGWSNRLWVGFATLWFFWPPILLLYRGASAMMAMLAL